MLKLYYKIWVDAIVAQQSKKIEGHNWKSYTMIPISLLQGINLLTVLYWMKVVVNRNLPLFLGGDVFNVRALNGYLGVLLTFFIPFVILNYLLIFYNQRYKELIKRYPYKQGIIYFNYMIYSIGLLIVPIVIRIMFFM